MQGFFRNFTKNFFVDRCFFNYSQRFGGQPLNPQESVYEKIYLITVHLQKFIFIFSGNSEYLAEINVFVSVIFKISTEFNLANGSQIHNIHEKSFQGNALRDHLFSTYVNFSEQSTFFTP